MLRLGFGMPVKKYGLIGGGVCGYNGGACIWLDPNVLIVRAEYNGDRSPYSSLMPGLEARYWT